jgi:hypothetical protein
MLGRLGRLDVARSSPGGVRVKRAVKNRLEDGASRTPPSGVDTSDDTLAVDG